MLSGHSRTVGYAILCPVTPLAPGPGFSAGSACAGKLVHMEKLAHAFSTSCSVGHMSFKSSDAVTGYFFSARSTSHL